MKIKFHAGCEIQDQGYPGGLRRFDAGQVCDLPDALALGLINAGWAEVPSDVEEQKEAEPSPAAPVSREALEEAVAKAVASVEKAQEKLADASDKAKAICTTNLAKAEKKLAEAQAALDAASASGQ